MPLAPPTCGSTCCPRRSSRRCGRVSGSHLATRLEGYRKASDVAAVHEALRRSRQLQGEIWTQAVAGSRLPDAHPDAAK